MTKNNINNYTRSAACWHTTTTVSHARPSSVGCIRLYLKALRPRYKSRPYGLSCWPDPMACHVGPCSAGADLMGRQVEPTQQSVELTHVEWPLVLPTTSHSCLSMPWHRCLFMLCPSVYYLSRWYMDDLHFFFLWEFNIGSKDVCSELLASSIQPH